jgi:hypothetical protein
MKHLFELRHALLRHDKHQKFGLRVFETLSCYLYLLDSNKLTLKYSLVQVKQICKQNVNIIIIKNIKYFKNKFFFEK